MTSRRRSVAYGTLGAVLVLAFLAMPLRAEAQQKAKVYKLGVLHGGDVTPAAVTALEQGLRDRGWLKGHNLAIEYRGAGGDLQRLPSLAAELVDLKVDLIVAATAPETRAARLATRTIPIVFVAHGDPVGVGDIQSLSRPGGNVTGFAQMHPELATKQLELLRELGPRVARVAVLWNASVATKAGRLARADARGPDAGRRAPIARDPARGGSRGHVQRDQARSS